MKNSIVVILLLPILSIGQSYFQKNYDFSGGQDEGFNILKDGSNYILYGSGFDTLGKAGIRFLKVDRAGGILLKKEHTSRFGMYGGINTIRYGDSLITGGTIFLKHNGQYVRHAMLFFMSLNGDSLGMVTYGDSLTTYHYRYIAQTPDSGVIAAGYNYVSQGGADGTQKMVLVKYNKYFEVEWTRAVTSAGNFTGPNTVTVVGRHIYVGAHISNNSRLPLWRYYANVRKYSLDGTLKINKNFDYQDGVEGAFVYPASNGVFVTTLLDSGAVNPRPMLYSYLAKLDTNLNFEWKTEIKIQDAAVNFIPKEQADGAILASGVYWEKEFVEYTTSRGYLAKYDSLGTILWERVYTGPQWNDNNGFSNFVIDDSGISINGICMDGISSNEVSMNFWFVKTDSNGCISPTTCTDISLEEIKTENKSRLVVYPQPANKLLKIKFSSSEDVKAQSIMLISANGKEMFRREFLEGHVNSLEINVESWPDGVYFLSVTSWNGDVMTKKILKG